MSQIYSRSEKGQVRKRNEDSILAELWPDGDEPDGLTAIMAVADGMGGHDRGDWASSTAIEAIRSVLESGNTHSPLEFVTGCISRANKEILTGSVPGISKKPPGTTLTIAVISGNSSTIGHVGDSRAYLFRDGSITQLTKDDTILREMIENGQIDPEKASESILHGQLTESVGLRETVEPQFIDQLLEQGDILLLCSDGLTGMLGDDEIGGIITIAESVEKAGDALVSTAENAGGHDNISVALYSHGTWKSKIS